MKFLFSVLLAIAGLFLFQDSFLFVLCVTPLLYPIAEKLIDKYWFTPERKAKIEERRKKELKREIEEYKRKEAEYARMREENLRKYYE